MKIYEFFENILYMMYFLKIVDKKCTVNVIQIVKFKQHIFTSNKIILEKVSLLKK